MSGVFAYQAPDGLRLANSLTGLLAAIGSELVPDGDYPTRFVRLLDGIGTSPLELPTTRGPVRYHFWWNLLLEPDGRISVVRKPDEAPFTSFADYRSRISAALASAFANAGAYEPVLALSSGYDSTTVAVLASENGCRHALTFAEGRPHP